MLDQPLSRRLRAIREADAVDPGRSVEPEPEPQSLAAPRRAPLGQLLVENGVLAESQLDEALERQRLETRPLGQILLEMGAVTPQDLARALTRQHGVDVSDSLRRRLTTDPSEPETEERYVVREDAALEPVHVADTFLDAADAAFALIEARDPGRLEILRSRGGELEHVWSYERDAATDTFDPPLDAA
jgi:hypothetical protein